MSEDDNKTNDKPVEEFIHEGVVAEDPPAEEASQKKVVAHHQSSQFSGPLPPPSMLKEYNELFPGAGERIFVMAENEAHHRHTIERTLVNTEANEIRLGQIFALIIGVTALVSGTYAAVNEAELAGGLIGAGGVLGLVTVFIMGRKVAPGNDNEELTSTDTENERAD